MVERSLIRGALRKLPALAIIDAVADTARAWADVNFPPRQQCAAAVEVRTGYSASVVQFALDQLFAPITSDALTATIADELGSVDALDGFISRAGRPDAFADTIGDVCIIASRTTVGVALLPAVYALCAKCDVTVKDREDQLIAAFFRTLEERHEAFSHAARAQTFASSDESAQHLEQFTCVVAFGRDQTLQTIRNACDSNTRFVGFGSRASAGYISADASRDELGISKLLEGAAHDVALYETEGCMSLHMLFVEGVSGAEAVARRLAGALERASKRFSAGTRDDLSSARFATTRSAAAFRASLGEGVLFAGGDFVVVFSPSHQKPPSLASRFVSVIPVNEPAEARRYIGRCEIALEAFALSDAREDIVQMAIEAGAVRLTRFGELQAPPTAGHHGGRARITDFIRWIDREI